jgi:hypothetical protein
LIYAGGKVVAAARSCTISMNVDDSEVSNPASTSTRNHIAGRKSWTMTITKLVTVAHTFFENLDQEVRLSFMVRGSSTDRMTGNAIVKNAEVSGTVGSLTTGNFTFQGSGPLAYQNGDL